MRRLLMRILGVDALLAEITALAADVLALQEQAVADAAMRRSTLDILNRMLEPARTDGCQKVRLRDRREAEAFAALVERGNAVPAGTLEPYRCPTCPRHPLELSHFWHIRHKDPTKRGKGAAQYRRTRPREMGRISPADIARIRAKVEGAG